MREIQGSVLGSKINTYGLSKDASVKPPSKVMVEAKFPGSNWFGKARAHKLSPMSQGASYLNIAERISP